MFFLWTVSKLIEITANIYVGVVKEQKQLMSSSK